MARTPARLPNGARISDFVTLGVLTTTVPAELIDGVLQETGRQSQRYRLLPAPLVVYYVMALALYAHASYGEVLRCLLEGVRWLRLRGIDIAAASKSAITRARIRLGVAPMKELYRRVARPLAVADTPGAWLPGAASGEPRRHHDRPARYARPGDPFWSTRGSTRDQQLSPTAFAGVGRDQHPCDLCRGLRSL